MFLVSCDGSSSWYCFLARITEMGSRFYSPVESVCFSLSFFIIQVLFERWQSQVVGQDEELEAWISSNTVSRCTMVHLLRSILVLFWTCHPLVFILFLVFLILVLKEIVNKSILLTFCGPFFYLLSHPPLSFLFREREIKYVWAFLM